MTDFSDWTVAAQAVANPATGVDVADDTKHYAYSNTIFANQPATEGGGYTDKQLTADFPASIGLTGDALAKFNACYSGRQTQDWVINGEANNVIPVVNNSGSPAFLYGSDSKLYQDASGRVYPDDPSKGTQVGVNGTPTILVNGIVMNWTTLFDASYAPVASTSADLLAILDQAAGV